MLEQFLHVARGACVTAVAERSERQLAATTGLETEVRLQRLAGHL
ncbi:MAG TPA: hypothetical protein VNZ01_13520 [Solirubrobacteraceae bacterium]|nr:hypothetical protein [Solirubrobacteraceae bacterium]